MARQDSSETPVMKQYRAAKSAHPDALVFFRMGDFYELFYEDAVLVSRLLDLTLTSRHKGADEPVPMAGVPHHAAGSYIQKLLDRGHRVALCEQMGDPSKIKGIVPREVVRVVSPGVPFDDGCVNQRENHFLVGVSCVSLPKNAFEWGIASLDVTTSEFRVCSAPDLNLALSELIKLGPRELLVNRSAEPILAPYLALRPSTSVQRYDEDVNFSVPQSHAFLSPSNSPKKKSDPFEYRLSRAASEAASLCLRLAQRSEPKREILLFPFSFPQLYHIDSHLILDEAAQRHLELTETFSGEKKGSLLTEIDMTITAPGARMLRRRLLAPFVKLPLIRRAQDLVESFVIHSKARKDLREYLNQVRDLDRLSTKIVMRRTSPRDLLAIRQTLDVLPSLNRILSEAQIGSQLKDYLSQKYLETGEKTPIYGPESQMLDPCEDAKLDLIQHLTDDPPVKLSDGNVIREDVDPDLKRAKEMMRSGERWMTELETRLRQETDISSLKVKYTRVFGWYIEVTRTHMNKVPTTWRRKQTIATGERYTTDELEQLATELEQAEETVATKEVELFEALLSRLETSVLRFRHVANLLAELDVSSSLAEVAHLFSYTKPVIDESCIVNIQDGRHPVIERLVTTGSFVPNDVYLNSESSSFEPSENASREGQEGSWSDEMHGESSPESIAKDRLPELSRLWLITGPNMAGKSTLIRQVALLIILAQMGAYVPAKKMQLGLVDRILTRVGASDNLSKGDSTFMVEMKETAELLRRASPRSFVILDEIGRGTSTLDGLSIAWSVVEYIYQTLRCRTLFATHYHELTGLTSSLKYAANYSVTAREYGKELIFLHKLKRGPASRSFGVACARLAGLPDSVLCRAEVLLTNFEKKSREKEHALEQLELFHSEGKTPELNKKKADEDPVNKRGTERHLFEKDPYFAFLDHISHELQTIDPNQLTPFQALQYLTKWKEQLSIHDETVRRDGQGNQDEKKA